MQDGRGFSTSPYPVRVRVDYPDGMSRLSTFFRWLLVIPVMFFLYLFNGGIVAIWAAVIVRGRIPRWLFDFQVGYNRFSTRAAAYFLLLTDKYPAFEGPWVVDYDVDYPARISRWKIFFWKFLASVPHIFVLVFLWIAALFCVFIGWFAILFTGNFPRGLHSFVVGVLRWTSRVAAYIESLTDEFPPYSLAEGAGAGANEVPSLVLGVVVGLVVIVAAGAGAAVAWRYGSESETLTVSRDDALSGSLTAADVEFDDMHFNLVGIEDDATSEVFSPSPGHRLVVVTLDFMTERGRAGELDDDDLPQSSERYADVGRHKIRLQTDEGERKPILITVDGLIAPVDVRPLEDSVIQAFFDIGEDEQIEEVRAYTNFLNRRVEWLLE